MPSGALASVAWVAEVQAAAAAAVRSGARGARLCVPAEEVIWCRPLLDTEELRGSELYAIGNLEPRVLCNGCACCVLPLGF